METGTRGLWRYEGWACYDETYVRPEPTLAQLERLDKEFGGPIGVIND